MKTLLVDRDAWDLILNARGDIALASNPYAISQDVASAIKLFKSELWYDQTKGIPYFDRILGQWPPLALVRAYVEKAALTVPEVVQARCVNLSLADRTVTGAVEVIDTDGAAHNVTF